MTVDRTPKPCLHPKANHQHGTEWAYTADGCRCWECTSESNRQARARYARRINGQPGLVPTDPVRTHVRAHMAAGATLNQVAHEAGITLMSLSAIMYGGRTMMLASTADEILAVELVHAPDEPGRAVVVPSIGARRRVQALGRIGWSRTVIADRSGVCTRTIDELSWREGILAGNHRAIVRAYDAMWDTQPPEGTCYQRAAATKIRRAAERRGWPPPMAWDDETIDDPAAVPDYGQVPDESNTRMNLYQQGLSDGQIGAAVGVSTDAIQKWRTRRNLPSNYYMREGRAS